MNLKTYFVVLELVRRMGPRLLELKRHSAALGDQAERALVSLPLNVSDGAYSRGRNKAARYQTAAGSAREVLACWETAEALGWVGPLDVGTLGLFDQVLGTLVRLVHPRPRAPR